MQTQTLSHRTPQETMIDRVCKLAMAVVDLQARGLSVRAAEICAGDLGTVIEIDEPVNDASINGFETGLLTPLGSTCAAGTAAPVVAIEPRVRFRLHGCLVYWTIRRVT
jgi:hypothetical protein